MIDYTIIILGVIVMNQIISMIESSVEEQEKQAEKLHESRGQILSREKEIENSINQLESDIAVSRILENKLSDIQKEREGIDKEVEKFKSEMSCILEQIEEAETTSEGSADAVSELENLGEDVGDSKNIVSERRTILENCRERIGEMFHQLGEVFSGNKGNGGASARINSGEQTEISEQPMEKLEELGPEKSEEEQKIEKFNKMIDESVRKHGEMCKEAHVWSPYERHEEHGIYTENAKKAKEEFAAGMKNQNERKIEN